MSTLDMLRPPFTSESDKAYLLPPSLSWQHTHCAQPRYFVRIVSEILGGVLEPQKIVRSQWNNISRYDDKLELDVKIMIEKGNGTSSYLPPMSIPFRFHIISYDNLTKTHFFVMRLPPSKLPVST